MSNILKAIAGSKNTPIKIGNVNLECYVLEDGTRVFSGNGLQKALEFPTNSGGSGLSNMLNTGMFKNIVTAEIRDKINNRKEFERPGAGGKLSKTYGYDVTLLIDICDLLIEGKNQDILTDKQKEYARVAEMIIRSVAKVGIIALVDEATGYQYEREKDELQLILRAYISEELLPWQKKFPDEYYKELFRLNGWQFDMKGIKKRPGVIGTWTNTLIYDELPPGVKEELKAKTPISQSGNKTARYHQFLTEDIGNQHLKSQLDQTLMLFRLSDNMKDMWYKFKKAKERKNGQLDLPYEFDNKGYTIEPIESLEHNDETSQNINSKDNKVKQGKLF